MSSTPATTTTSVAQTVGNPDANIGVVGTAPVIKIGNANASVGLFGATPAAQPAAIANAAVDAASAIAQLNLLLAALRTLGVIAT